MEPQPSPKLVRPNRKKLGQEPSAPDSRSQTQLATPETLLGWQRKILRRVFKGTFWACLFTLLVDLQQAVHIGDYRFVLPLGIALVGLACIAFLNAIPFALRTSVFVLLLCGVVTETLITNAFLAPNSFVVATVTTVLIALNVGQRAAWLTLGLFVCALVSGATYYLSGAPAPDTVLFDTTLPGNWFRVSAAFFIATGICLVAVSYLTKKLEGAVAEAFELMTALRKESEEKVQALKKQSQLEAQLRQAQELENLGRLAGGVAHDFNNLLVVIINNAELLRRRTEPDNRQELDAIDQAGNRAAALIRTLLTFGRHHDEDVDNIDLNSTLEDSLSLVKRLLPANVELQFRPGSKAGSVNASKVDIEQLTLNLCVNARDAMPGGGRLLVQTGRCQRRNPSHPDDETIYDFAQLRVTDTGEGIREEDQNKVFDAFFTTKGPGHGTGLGLSVVKRVVNSMGGFIGLNSSRGEGSEFVIHLPAVKIARVSSSHEPQVSGASGGSETILIVDDEEAVRTVTGQLLEQVGYQVILCQDATDALEQYEKARAHVALIVSDVMMPGRTGKDLYDIIHAKGDCPPFVFCTGYAADLLPENFFANPARVLLTKPFRAADLRGAVRSLLDQTKSSS